MAPVHITPSTRRALLLAAGLLYAVVAIASGIHRGEDIENHLRLADLLLAGQNFYEPRPPFGSWWLPAAIGLLTPLALLARLSLPLAKAAFALVGLGLLYWTIARTRADWKHIALALAAVAGPIQFDFRYLNISVILLATLAAAARDLESQRDARAGVWIGLATALKLFPGLVIGYLVLRRRWRAASAAIAVALVTTAVPLLVLGVERARATVQSWFELSAAGMPVRRLGNQALPQLLERMGAPSAIVWVAALAITALAAGALARRRAATAEVALVTLVMVLLSPIAWWYYFVLTYPAWIVVLERLDARAAPGSVAMLAVAGILSCGILGPRALGLPVISAGVFMWGALSLYGALLWRWRLVPVAT